MCSEYLWTAKWWTENNTPGGMQPQSTKPLTTRFDFIFQIPLGFGRMMAPARHPPTLYMNDMQGFGDD